MTKKTKIIIGSAAVMILAVLVAVVSLRRPSDPLDWKFSIETFEDDMDKVFENLSEDDRGAIISALMLDYMKEDAIQGKTYRELLERGRQMEKDFMDMVGDDMDAFFKADSLQKDSIAKAKAGL
ncbi:MAG: hypothetical protein IJ382_07035 [Flavobacteriales bacterium]|nr:hypothetical protein [Flavobacteriales bacterium]